MDESEADRWIELLGSDFDGALVELVKLGEPALRRLFQASEGLVLIADGSKYVIDEIENRKTALGYLGKLHPEALLGLVSGKKYLKTCTIWALKSTGDERLKTIANEALKVLGDDWGANYPNYPKPA